MEQFFAFFALAIAVEGTISHVSAIFEEGKLNIKVVASLVLGIGIAVAYGVDVIAILGLQSAIPYLGQVITGIALGRGSNVAYEFIAKLTSAGVREGE